ncbi:hypothetical protein SDC9_164796 [bioreactor metagenome]|uniref:Uncharacterized protein n=1 Tax=bioreactor metagenome TaxID=1076179 RepID=A0A645FZU8_9ZZZZ
MILYEVHINNATIIAYFLSEVSSNAIRYSIITRKVAAVAAIRRWAAMLSGDMISTAAANHVGSGGF